MLLGLDIGGTKCALVLGALENDTISIADRVELATTQFDGPDNALEELAAGLRRLVGHHRRTMADISALGISCGGPLDSRRGTILGPPNLPGWDHVRIVDYMRTALGLPVYLENDANACALAEWRWGAGRGADHMIFLTFGTGMGAGLILNGALYRGACDQAGEVGHVRLAADGPEGYGKRGSFEGFCSGGGIGRLAKEMIDAGTIHVAAVPSGKLDVRTIAECAARGDDWACEIFRTVAGRLGQGLSILIDVFNPQVIVIGGIFMRQSELLLPIASEVIERETLGLNQSACRIVPAALGEAIGDYACLSVAMDNHPMASDAGQNRILSPRCEES